MELSDEVASLNSINPTALSNRLGVGSFYRPRTNKTRVHAGFVGTITAMSDEMKKCKYCAREIGKDATFCWYCGRELEARPERPEAPQPESRLGRWLLIGLGVAALVVLMITLIGPLLR